MYQRLRLQSQNYNILQKKKKKIVMISFMLILCHDG